MAKRVRKDHFARRTIDSNLECVHREIRRFVCPHVTDLDL